MKTLSTRIGAGLIGLTFLATALPAFADTTAAANVIGTYNVACTQTAVATHEDANTSALNTYNASVSAALAVRKTDIVAAWAQTSFSARFDALKAAIVKYRTSVKTAHDNYKNARTSANTSFETSMKACGVTAADVHGNGKLTKKEGKIGLGLGLWGDFGLHLGGHGKNK